MTAARQDLEGSQAFKWLKMAVRAVIVVITTVWLGGSFGTARATTTERVVVDRMSGLAIFGFDPVGYFTEAQPIRGDRDTEANYHGAVWRFRNEGNRIAFLAHPEIYAPRFGGYDPVDLARGKTVETYPAIWLIVDQRLYLFSSDANRTAFGTDVGRYLGRAEERWPELRNTLAQ